MINGTADTDALAAVITSDFGDMFPWPQNPFEPAAPEEEIAPDPDEDLVVSGGVV